MNEKIRSRLPKPEWKKILKRITKSDKVAIAKEYDKRLKKESREDILEDLASKWDRSTRRIESHVSEGRQMITYEKQAAESKRIQTDVLKEQVKKHFDELAEAARALHHIQQLLLIDSRSSIYRELVPTSVAKFMMQTVIGATFSPPVYFLEHFRLEFPDLDITSWMAPLPVGVVDRLRYLGNTAGFKYCPTCQACNDMMT